MTIRIEINEADLKRLILNEIHAVTGQSVEAKNVNIEVKSAQNYKSEWEKAQFRAVYQIGT